MAIVMKNIKNKFWFRLFVRTGIVFVVFLAVLSLANTTLLSKYYIWTQKKVLKDQAETVKAIDISDRNGTINTLTEIQDKYGVEIEIYTATDKTLYTTTGGQMLSYFYFGSDKIHMNHRPLRPIEQKIFPDGSILETAEDPQNLNRYLVYRAKLEDGNFVELRMQIALLQNSAKIANTFITIVTVVCFLGALIWVFYFSKKTAKPISEMSAITKDMAALNFERKLMADQGDEIGELAASINDLSNKLDITLKNLKASNAQLRSEIELERQLDGMRRGFVANVSHELKTPISIIQGYAEGLKVNIKSEAREKYCDTIIDESRRMNKLVLSILNLSKFESGQIALSQSNFNISALLKNIGTRIFEGKNAIVSYQLPQELLVRADSDHIEQVIKSLMENAASHVNEGGNIEIYSEDKEQTIRINIYNSGSHIDEESMPQIWQSFYRGDTSHKRDNSRFGLGLSIVGAIMKLHGRECGVYNTNDGVCFWFSLDKTTSDVGELQGEVPIE